MQRPQSVPILHHNVKQASESIRQRLTHIEVPAGSFRRQQDGRIVFEVPVDADTLRRFGVRESTDFFVRATAYAGTPASPLTLRGRSEAGVLQRR